MKTFPILLLCLLLALTGCRKSTKDAKAAPEEKPKPQLTNKEKLQGNWRLIRSAAGAPGVVLEFLPNGTVKTTAKSEGRTLVVEGAWEVVGDKLKITRKEEGEDVSEVLTIKSLTDKTLVTVDAKGREDEFEKQK